MSNKVIVDVPFGVGHVRFEHLSVEQANVLSHICDNQIRQPRIGATLHTFKVLTTEEVMEGRSSKYDFINFNKWETIEEASERYLDSPTPHSYRLAVKWGVQWQKERGYNDEEVKSAFRTGFSIGYGSDTHALDEKHKTCEEWFEKFKKK